MERERERERERARERVREREGSYTSLLQSELLFLYLFTVWSRDRSGEEEAGENGEKGWYPLGHPQSLPQPPQPKLLNIFNRLPSNC